MPKKKLTLTVFEKHALAIARKTILMPDAIVAVMGPPTKDEAHATIARLTRKQ